MNYKEVEQKYLDRVNEWAETNREWLIQNNWPFSTHARHIAAKALMTRDKINPFPGHFISAIVSNNLRDTVGRADSECRQCLFAILMCYWNVETFDLPKPQPVTTTPYEDEL